MAMISTGSYAPQVFRHAHLFCGVGSGARGFNLANPRIGQLRGVFECVGGIDVDAGAIRQFRQFTGVDGTVMDLFDRDQYETWHGKAPQPGWREAVPDDVYRVFGPDLDVMFTSAPCLPAGGLVVTRDGVRPISEVCPGDQVLTHTGAYRNVAKVNARTYRGTIHGFRLNGTVDFQEFTEEHPLWVRRTVRPGPEKKRQSGDALWTQAKLVKVGDRVGFPITPYDPSACLPGHPEKIDAYEWFLLGAYIGDGYRARQNEVRYCVGAADGDLAVQVRASLSMLGINYWEDRSAGATNIKICARSERLNQLCSLFGDGAPNKQIPEPVFSFADDELKMLIDGYRAADGSDRGRRPGAKRNTLQAQWKIVSTSLQLLRDVQRIMLRFGVFGGVHVAWPGGEQEIMGRIVQTRPRWEYSVRLDPVKRTTFEFEDGAVWVRVRAIAARETVEPVYNLEVDVDDTYCSPLIATHNCKGFSGLLSASKSKTDKYQALNRLTVRGIWLTLEAYKHDPIPIILFENVPRIMTRGNWLLEEIKQLLRAYGYIVNEDKDAIHDCGEIAPGGLAQTRKRYLLIARHPLKVPSFVYQPDKHRLRGVGEVLERLPLPGDPAGGVHHRIPKLQWLTWVRLAMVEAGKDWRSLNRLRVEDGFLSDYGIVPDFAGAEPWRDNVLGVLRWADSASHLVGNQRSPLHGKVSIADVRVDLGRQKGGGGGILGVTPWGGSAATLSTRGFPLNGAFSVADIRPVGAPWFDDVLGVYQWVSSARTIPGRTAPSNGTFAIADVRVDGHVKSVQLGVRKLTQAAPCLKGDMSVGGGPYAIADCRMDGAPRFNQTYRIVRLDEAARAVGGPGMPAGGQAVADPRAPDSPLFKKNKYKVTPYDRSAGSVIGASTTGDGAFAVADVRGGPDPKLLHGCWNVSVWIGPSNAVIGGRKNGASAIADPRPLWGTGRHENVLRVVAEDQPTGTIPANAHSVTGGQPCVADSRRENYQTAGHYGVLAWSGSALAVSGSACHDNGFNSCADPRNVVLRQAARIELPAATDKVICRIISEDGTWHRPFTTLELGGLQSMYDPEEAFAQDPETGLWMTRAGFEMLGGSDATVREWIGNAVPSLAAQGMAETVGETLLLARAGESAFRLDARPIWAKPLGLALAIDSRQPAYEMDGGRL